MPINSQINLPPEVQQSCDDILLSVKTPRLIHKLGAVTKELKEKGGSTLRMSRYDRLPTAPVPLGQDGAPIPSTPLARVDIDATVSIYGMYSAINQRVFLQNQDNVLSEVSELMGLSMRMTEDQLSRDALASGATQYWCVNGQNGDQPSNLSLPDIGEVTSGLLSNDAWMIFDREIGEDRFATAPVRDAYLAMGHTDLSQDLNNLNQFIPKWNYPNQNSQKLAAEWGSVNNVRFMLSSVGLKRPFASALGRTVYSVFVQGLEAVGCVYQDNFSARIIYKGPEFSDALQQNITIGYTFSEVTRVLNDLWISQMLCTLNN